MNTRKEQSELNNAGFTLVEMVVAFALLALFMVAVTRVLSYTVSLYHTTQASANGLEVSGIISNKLVGLIEGASEIIDVDEDSIKIIDETDTTITISTKDNYIDIKYAAVTTPSGGTLAETDWTFDDNVYMGFTVSELQFIHPLPDDYPNNVIKMVLTLHNDKYGNNDYTSTCYIKCPGLEDKPLVTASPTPSTP